MKDWALQVYHRLPAPARSLAASLRGLSLRRLRYGPETERLIAEALEREHWSAEQWKSWQQKRLEYVLQRAATMVPYYRKYWLQRGRRGDQCSWEVLENWPILKKEALRENPLGFVADDCDTPRMYREHTSGTTGTPLNLWWTRQTVRAWYALFEARVRMWHGVSRNDNWAILGGQLVTPFRQSQPPFWVWNATSHQLYMSCYHLSPDYIPAYLEALRRYRVEYILGYPSAMYALARAVLQRGLDAPTLRVAISNAEPLYQHQRGSIATAFQCPVHDTYGMSEIACAASECREGTLHIWPDVGVIEALRSDADEPVPFGQTGRFICTGLVNADMPLIRYEVGDHGALASPLDNSACACGRKLPVMLKVEGRLDDVIRTRNGRSVGRLDPVFKSDLPIREAQIIQESLDCIRVRFVPTPEYTAQDGVTLGRRLRERVGEMDILLEPVDHIPRAANGKFRAVMSNLMMERTDFRG